MTGLPVHCISVPPRIHNPGIGILAQFQEGVPGFIQGKDRGGAAIVRDKSVHINHRLHNDRGGI